MFRRAFLVIVLIFFTFGCAGDMEALRKKVKEAVPVSIKKEFLDSYCNTSGDGKVQTCLEAYAPVLFISGSYADPTILDYEPKEIYSMLNESDLHGPVELEKESDKVYDFREVNISSLDIKNLFYSVFSPDKFDLNMRDADPGFLFYRVPEPERFNDNYRTMVYGREAVYEAEAEETVGYTGYRVLQYFFFYPYNNWLNKHEGDWEMIQVILDEETKTALKITYFWHNGGDTFDWDDSRIEKIADTHPAVYVASGSHASYWSKGDHKFSQFGLPCFFTDHTIPIKTLVPESAGISSLDIPEDLRGLLMETYTLSGNIDQAPWTRWGGYWGETEILSISGSSGPRSPYYQKVDDRYSKWKNPTAFANNPRTSYYHVCAQSPVKLHLYDSDGNHVGRTGTGDLEVTMPGLYIYSPDDKQIIIHTSDDLILKIEAEDKGEFDFGLTRYQNENSTLTDVSYYDVQIIAKTVATLQVSMGNPEFTMEIDLDGDGIIDQRKNPEPGDMIFKKIPVGDLPEKIKQVSFPAEVDGDGDAIFDLRDNCPGKFNPDQGDLDNNGKGDVCDDFDRDMVSDYMDNCPRIPGSQLDTDRDGRGDICDKCPNDIMNDADQDGFCRSKGDCNDLNAGINPDAAEVCNGIDDNCNGRTDEGFVVDKDGKCIDVREDVAKKDVRAQETSCPSGYELWGSECLRQCSYNQKRDSSGRCVTKETEVISIFIYPQIKTIRPGDTISFTAVAKFDDGSVENVTNYATWFPGTSFTGMEAGIYIIEAKYKGVKGNATVSVEEPIKTAEKTKKTCPKGYELCKSECFQRCTSAYARNPDTCVCEYDISKDIAPGSRVLKPSKRQIAAATEYGDKSMEERLQRSGDWGATGGGEPQGQEDYGRPPERETRECERDSECQYGQTCQEGKCVTPEYLPYPPHGSPPDDTSRTGTDWVDWATSPMRSPEESPLRPPVKPPSGGGGVVQCSTTKKEGGDKPETHKVELGRTSGTFLFEYDTLTQEDRMLVKYEGSTKFDTGCVGTKGWKSKSISYSGGSTKISVEIKPNCKGGTNTRWFFKANCP